MIVSTANGGTVQTDSAGRPTAAPIGPASTNPANNVLTQGQSYMGGTVNYDTASGAKLATGATTLANPIANQSTTALTSNKAADILGIQNKQNTLSNGTGIRTDSNTGIATYANGSVVQPPKAPNDPSNMYNTETGQLNTNYTGYKPPATDGTTSTGGYNGNIYIAPGGILPKDSNGNPVQLTATNPQDDAFNQKILDLMARSDANGAAQLQNIQDSYANLIKQQEEANKSAAAGTTAYLVGAGRGVVSSDAVLQGTISYGLQQIANLQTQKNGDIIKAQQAISADDFKYASAIQDRIDKNTALQQKEYDTVQEHILQASKDLQAQQQKNIDDINAVAKEAAKSGAPADVMKAITSAKSPAEAIQAYAPYAQDPTSDAGQYNAYVKSTQAKGLVPLSAGDFLAKQEAKKAYNNAYAAASAKNAADAKSGKSNTEQQKLEQQGRQIIAKEFSARTGALGVENAKVNQANHLNALFSQYLDPKTGNYNIPKTQYAELAIGLATLVSPTGTPSEGTINNIMQSTGKGDLNNALTYATGVPFNGSSQEVFKNLIDSVDRQAETAQRNRQAALDNMKDLLPTDLEQSRKDQLIKATNMVDYEGADRIAKENVDNYVKANPTQAETISKLFEIPGANDINVQDYLRANGLIP